MGERVSITEASRILGVAPNTVRKLISSGELRAYKIKGVLGIRVEREDVEALITPVEVKSTKSRKKK